MSIEVPQKKEISGGEKNGGRKGVCSAICRRRENSGSINIKERERGEVALRDVDPYTIRVEVKRRKRGSRKLRER